MRSDLTWMIGGPQGTGVDSAATLFARAATAAGYWVYGKREYHSNIKGEHSYFLVRVCTQPIQSFTDPVHVLATFEAETAHLHQPELTPDGCLLYDPANTQPLQPLAPSQDYPLDYTGWLSQLAERSGKPAAQLSVLKNTLSVAASLALLGIPASAIERIIPTVWSKPSVITLNEEAVRLVYVAFGETVRFPHRLAPPPPETQGIPRLVVNGAIATALGKVKAGCRMQTYYSITPAVDECIFLEQHPESGVLVFQCEDELAAMTMAIGAATTGARASTSTSGPGFSLMAEALGWAGINEVPVVVFNYQRGGPSTGLPTRHEQSDLLFALSAGHGEFPRLVVAPGTVEESYQDAFSAFNWAERYQTPVIVLQDKALANNTHSVPRFDQEPLTIDRGLLMAASTDETEDTRNPLATFPRFQLTDTGLSPRPLPGMPGHIYWQTGDEHTELGHITEDPPLRLAMHEKRFRKLALAAADIPLARQVQRWGPDDAAVTLVCWGSTVGAVRDALPVLQAAHHITANALQIRLLSPFPAEAVTQYLQQGQRLILIEMNMTAQLGQLIRQQTGIAIPQQILKWTGRPISQTEVVKAVVQLDQDQTDRVVLQYGL